MSSRQSLDYRGGRTRGQNSQPRKSFTLDRPGLSLVTALGGPALLIVQPGTLFAPNPLRHAA